MGKCPINGERETSECYGCRIEANEETINAECRENSYDDLQPKGNDEPLLSEHSFTEQILKINSVDLTDEAFDIFRDVFNGAMGKPSNPKDVVALTKLPLDLVPSTVVIYAALAFLEGARKYGKYNWRVAGVSFAVYLGAIKRHYEKLISGEWADQKTKVPHLASIIACCGIILDAKLCGKLTDDRPPVAPTAELIAELEAEIVPHLQELFKDCHPHQHTIMDAQKESSDV